MKRLKYLLPQLHIELDLIKNFVNAMHRNGNRFLQLKAKIHKLINEKLKEDILSKY